MNTLEQVKLRYAQRRKETSLRLNFFQYICRFYEEDNITLNSEDWTTAISQASLNHKPTQNGEALLELVELCQRQPVGLQHKHFQALIQASELNTKPNWRGLTAWAALFLGAEYISFAPSAQEAIEVLKRINPQKEIEGWNVLHYALMYNHLGKTTLGIEHFDYLFEHCAYDVHKLDPDDRQIVEARKEKYHIEKEQLSLSAQITPTHNKPGNPIVIKI